MLSAARLAEPLKITARNARRLLNLAWSMDKRLTMLFYATSAVTALAPLAGSYAYKALIDSLQAAQQAFSSHGKIAIPVAVGVALGARYAVGLADRLVYWALNQSYLDYIFRYRLQNRIVLRFHGKISELDLAYFEQPATQDLMTKTRDTMMWRLPDFMRSSASLLIDVIGFAAAFIVLIPYGWWLPALLSALAVPRFALQARAGATQWSLWGSGAPKARKLWYLNYLLGEPLTVRETRIARSGAALMQRLEETQDHLFDLNKQALDRNLKVMFWPPLLETAVLLFIAWWFLPAVVAGSLSIGSFTLLVAMLDQLGGRAANASAHLASMYENSLYAGHFFEFLDLPPLLPRPANPVIFDKVAPPEIEFRNVSFEYPRSTAGGDTASDRRLALDNVSFTISAGESVALVGHNGAGKSTIVKLLCRFYDPTAGGIYINGVDLRQLDLDHWYKFLGTLFQEFVRYHFTVRDNIMLGAPAKNDDALMRAAAEKAGALEFIERLPQGFEQMLGKEFDNGLELSGGQWQKLAIARAFYEAPPLLILDEPTSSIDAEGEYGIFSSLEKQYRDKTLVLVSHRFSTVRNAQKIIVLDKGRIVETGSHAGLMKQKGTYAGLFALQAKGYQ
jgi:ATP-binding cassette subfamily B protein